MSELPEWPKRHDDYGMDWRAHSDAALARLRAISTRGYLKHKKHCSYEFIAGVRGTYCICGLDELLANLLPPGEGR